MFPMSKEESLVTIENGGQVATWSRLQHNRTTNLGGRIIIWISTKSTYPIIHREIITFFNYFTNDSIFSGINSKLRLLPGLMMTL